MASLVFENLNETCSSKSLINTVFFRLQFRNIVFDNFAWINDELYKSESLKFVSFAVMSLKLVCKISEPVKSQFMNCEPANDENCISDFLKLQFSKVEKSNMHILNFASEKSTFLNWLFKNVQQVNFFLAQHLVSTRSPFALDSDKDGFIVISLSMASCIFSFSGI